MVTAYLLLLCSLLGATARASELPTPRGSATPARAEPVDSVRHVALFAGPTLRSVHGDDFDGSTALVAPGKALFVPAIGSGPGLVVGAGGGLLWNRPGSFGGLLSVVYSVTWLSASLPVPDARLRHVTWHEVELPGRLTYTATRSLIPYIQASWGALIVSAAGSRAHLSGDSLEFEPDSAWFTGLSYGASLGGLLMISDSFAVDVSVGYRRFEVTTADGTPTDRPLGGGAWSLQACSALFL